MNTKNKSEWSWNFPTDLLVLMNPFLFILAFVTGKIGVSFYNLNEKEWCIGIALTFLGLLIGAALIFKAKLPLYRERRFFTFGSAHIPDELKKHYKIGMWMSLIGIIVAILLIGIAHLKG